MGGLLLPDERPLETFWKHSKESAYRPRETLARAGETRYAATLPELEVRIERADEGGAHLTLVLPYKNIWLKSHGERFEATVEATMKIVDAAGTEVWTFAKAFPVDIPQSRLKSVLGGNFMAEAVAPLGPGSYTLSVTVTNTNDGSKASLERKFEI